MKTDPNVHALSAARKEPDHSPKPRRILLVEDDDVARKQLQRLLQVDSQLQVEALEDGEAALKAVTEEVYSIIITDLRMPGFDGMDLIREVQKRNLPVTVIVTTGHASIDEAVEAIRLGAYDFLTKPINIENLRLVVQRALRERTLQDEVNGLRAELQQRFSFFNIISKNPRMHAVFELVGNLAHTTTTVLVEGETGTGKEQIARAIHEASSSTRRGPMVAVNCAALPESLLESELFGHEKGSFTSAVSQRKGRFELAEGGTIFLDEVGDVPPTMQAKLLRVLQERKFERVGGTQSIDVDVRIIAATNRSLKMMVKQGKFREDLYYRLNVVKVDLPPLRDRSEDIPLLATHFAQKYAASGEQPKHVSPAAMELLLNYPWPGNIRELENVMERACVTCHGAIIEPGNLPTEVVLPTVPKTALQIDLNRPLPEIIEEAIAVIEKDYIEKALEKSQGLVGRCAKICGMSRRTISSKIREYGLSKIMPEQ
jgi:DNA-binding NtrC family response regulator